MARRIAPKRTMKESFGTPSFLPCSPSFSSSFCPIASFAQTTTEAKCVNSPSKTSGDAPRQSMRADHLAVSGKTPNKAWQETNILYPRATKERLSGRISLKCTLGQPVLSEMAYYVRFKRGKRCRRVHFANISPEKPGFPAREYKICESCHYLAPIAIAEAWFPAIAEACPSHCRSLAPSHRRRKAANKKGPEGPFVIALVDITNKKTLSALR